MADGLREGGEPAANHARRRFPGTFPKILGKFASRFALPWPIEAQVQPDREKSLRCKTLATTTSRVRITDIADDHARLPKCAAISGLPPSVSI
jgi:hypothetical protein